MKKNVYLALFCLAAMSGCAKNEPETFKNKAQIAATQITASTLTVPVVPGYTPKAGIEPANPIPYPATPTTVPQGFGSTINYGSPSAPYFEGTCKFTISHLEEGSTYHQVNNDKINMAFYNGSGDKKPLYVRRLKPTTPSPYGWTAYWNNLKNVENEHPEVLFLSRFETRAMIVLSKPCVKFGMELSPNIQNQPLDLEVFWGNSLNDLSSGGFSISTQTPSGAMIFSLEGKKPFTVVTIRYYPVGGTQDINPEGLAIANIRYKLAKKGK
jgi:hypothetical protein